MLANTRVENDDLRALALARATIVQSTLAKTVPGGAAASSSSRRGRAAAGASSSSSRRIESAGTESPASTR